MLLQKIVDNTIENNGWLVLMSHAHNVLFPQIEYKDLSDECVKHIKDAGFDCVFALGGDGTQKSSRDFSLKGVNCIGIPKTIDNDLCMTDHTPGFGSAAKYIADKESGMFDMSDVIG